MSFSALEISPETQECEATVLPTVIRTLTYNLFIRPPGVNTHGNDYKSDRLSRIVKHFARFDLLAFQEMFAFGSNRRDFVISEAKKAGLHHSAFAKQTARDYFSFKIIDSGFLILSRYPIVSQDCVTYPGGTNVDKICAKGALSARIQVSESSHIHVITTHLQASYESNSSNAKNDEVREMQISMLRNFVNDKRKKHPEDAFVLLGDLNVDGRPCSVSKEQGLPHGAEYLKMLKLLDPNGEWDMRDLVYEHCGEHPVTVGDAEELSDGTLRPLETALTATMDQARPRSLDYIFFIPPLMNGSSSSEILKSVVVGDGGEDGADTPAPASPLTPAPGQSIDSPQADSDIASFKTEKRGNVRVGQTSSSVFEFVSACAEQFFVDRAKELTPFTQLSDHYGISAVFSVSSILSV